MIRKEKLKREAVALRKRGLSYSEILKKVPVAKSAISLWLREVGLAKRQKQAITKKGIEARLRGEASRRRMRLEREIYIHENAINTLPKVRRYWSKVTGFSVNSFEKIYFKKAKIRTKRTNIGACIMGYCELK